MKDIIDILGELHPEIDYTSSQNFIGDGILDSFDIVAIVSSLEDKFGIEIDGEEIIPENFLNIDMLTALVKRYLKDDSLHHE